MVHNRSKSLSSFVIITSFVCFLACQSIVFAAAVPRMYMENIIISVNCDTARLNLTLTLISTNSSQVHYPTEVDMNDVHMADCTSVTVAFMSSESILMFQFNGTTEAGAKNNADYMVPYMNSAFEATFVHVSTTPSYPYVIVGYEAEGKTDMTAFLGSLKTKCIASDVAGFSDVLPTLFTHAENPRIVISAVNMTQYWSHTLIAQYDTTFPLGPGSHALDLLYYLGTSVLLPSRYAFVEAFYMSYVSVTIESSGTISYVSCSPDETSMLFSAGWYVMQKGPGNTLSGMLYFGASPVAWEIITFTFTGTVVPEFPTFLIMPLLVVMTMIFSIVLKKKTGMIRVPPEPED